MFGHGTFIYNPKHALKKFGSGQGVADEMKKLGMRHAWLRVHNKNGPWHTTANLEIAQALKNNSIDVGVWGWNDGNNVQKDIANAKKAIDTYNPMAYIADIEHDVRGASWNVDKARTFALAVKSHLGQRPLIVSSFAYIEYHQPEIMAALDDIADFFAPQIYWFKYPIQQMVPKNDPVLSKLPLNNAASYSKICLHNWRQYVTKPLIMTGQAYWGEGKKWSQALAEKKLQEFADGFDAFDEVVGLNWWNFSAGAAMSDKMRALIGSDDFQNKLNVAFGTGGAAPLLSAATIALTTSASVGEKMFVATESLNFRSEPVAGIGENILDTLTFGDVALITEAILPNGYVKSVVNINGMDVEGYLFESYLRAPEAEKVERLVREAVDEWERFDRGNGIEDKEPYSSYINEMWTARGYPQLTGKDQGWAWSAVGMSFFLENADYTETKFDIRHSTYIHEAIQNRITGVERDFWGYRLSEAKPQIGDLICQWRGQHETNYDEAEIRSRFQSHTDVVISVRKNAIVTLGANVANPTSGGRGVSVETKVYPLNADGSMPTGTRVFAIMKNNHRPRNEQWLT